MITPAREMTHSIITINSHDGYPIKSRYWQSDTPRALLVFVHGVVSHSLWLESIAKRLAKDYTNVLAVDRRGAGMNRQGRGDAPSCAVLLADLEEVMAWAALSKLPIHLCGFCWGSNYIINFLQKKPTRFASMVFIAPSIFPSALIQQRPFNLGENVEPTEEPVMPIDQFTQGPLYQSFILPDPLRLKLVSKRLNSCMQQFSSGIWMNFLRLNLPCLMLLGTQDTVVDNDATQKVFERLKAQPKQLHFLNAHHGIQFDEPDSSADLISNWVNMLMTPTQPADIST